MNFSSNEFPMSWGLSGHTLPFMNRVYRKIKNHTLKHQSTGSNRKILLVAHNKMMLAKLNELVMAIGDESNIQWFCTIVRPPDKSRELVQEIKKNNYIYVHPYQASIQLWDLIIVADHHATHNFNITIPTLIIEHGMGDLKVILNSKERYHYARRNVLNKKNKPVYSCMFESSKRRKQEAIKDIPILNDSISVVGHIEVDKALAMNKNRSEIRDEHGYSNDDIVIFIFSSHGAGSLLDSIGHELIIEALTLPQKYKFILAAHFLNWQEPNNTGESLLQYESDRVRVLRPNDDFVKNAVISDMSLSDFTSGSLFFVMLNRPVFYIPFPSGVVSEKSPIWRFYCKAPRINKVKDLQALINNVDKYPKGSLETCSRDLVEYPGEAKQRMKKELFRLLNL